MINLFSGTPGSGKSLYMSKQIYGYLRNGKNVIANFDINTKAVKKSLFGNKEIGIFNYIPNSDLTVNSLIEFSKKYHKENKEGQTLICIDEAQVLFNSRSFNAKDRADWITFFSQHRKLGYTIILVSQIDRMLDRQIRGLIENEYKFRKVNNFKFGQLFPVSTFVMVQYWYCVKERVGSQFFTYSKKYGELYDTYSLFK